jgi:hypothetical protein
MHRRAYLLDRAELRRLRLCERNIARMYSSFRSPGHHRALLGLLLLTAVLCLPRSATAQLFSYTAERPRVVQSVTFGYYLVDFQFDGDVAPSVSFDYVDPAYGITYTRPNVQISVLLGDQRRDPEAGESGLRLLDFALFTWAELYLAPGEQPRSTRFFLPIILHSNYRRVAQKQNPALALDAFNVTVLGLGTGIGLKGKYGERVQLEARATPILGFALRAFGDAAGSTYLLDSDVQVHIGPITQGLGITFGYGFRYQVWNVNASDLFAEISDDFDYRGLQHVFRVGVNW